MAVQAPALARKNAAGNFVCAEEAGRDASSTSTVLESHLIIADEATDL